MRQYIPPWKPKASAPWDSSSRSWHRCSEDSRGGAPGGGWWRKPSIPPSLLHFSHWLTAPWVTPKPQRCPFASNPSGGVPKPTGGDPRQLLELLAWLDKVFSGIIYFTQVNLAMGYRQASTLRQIYKPGLFYGAKTTKSGKSVPLVLRAGISNSLDQCLVAVFDLSPSLRRLFLESPEATYISSYHLSSLVVQKSAASITEHGPSPLFQPRFRKIQTIGV